MEINKLKNEAKKSRTALVLSVQEWQAYHPGKVSNDLKEHESTQAKKRRQDAWHIARSAAQMLRKEFGAGRVVVFGSLAHDAWFTS